MVQPEIPKANQPPVWKVLKTSVNNGRFQLISTTFPSTGFRWSQISGWTISFECFQATGWPASTTCHAPPGVPMHDVPCSAASWHRASSSSCSKTWGSKGLHVKRPGFEPQWILEISCFRYLFDLTTIRVHIFYRRWRHSSNLSASLFGVQDLFWSIFERCTLAKGKENDSKTTTDCKNHKKKNVCARSPKGKRQICWVCYYGSSMLSLPNKRSMWCPT